MPLEELSRQLHGEAGRVGMCLDEGMNVLKLATAEQEVGNCLAHAKALGHAVTAEARGHYHAGARRQRAADGR